MFVSCALIHYFSFYTKTSQWQGHFAFNPVKTNAENHCLTKEIKLFYAGS
jgi:hypothetical protein